MMVERKVKKLPLVGPHGTLIGLFTARDLVQATRLPFATRDDRTPAGRRRDRRQGDYLERAVELIKAGWTFSSSTSRTATRS